METRKLCAFKDLLVFHFQVLVTYREIDGKKFEMVGFIRNFRAKYAFVRRFKHRFG